MNRRRLPLDLLKGFEAVARHLSFTKAAAELFVTQSAMSRQIRQLEEHLGVRLFERRTRAVVLTDAGHQYYVELAPLLKQLDELTEKVAAARPARRVRVTSMFTFSSLWLIPRLAAFQEQCPDVHVHVVADNVMRDLVRDDFDVAVRYCSKEDAGPGAVELFGERLTPVCSPQLLGNRKLGSVASLNDYVLIHFHHLDGPAPWLSWEHFLSRAGAAGVRGRGATYFSHYDQAIQAARAAQGFALGRLPLIGALVECGELVAPLDLAGPSERAYWLVTRPGPQRREVNVFVEWLKSAPRLP